METGADSADETLLGNADAIASSSVSAARHFAVKHFAT